MMSVKDDILEPFDFKKSPSMSSQLFKAALVFLETVMGYLFCKGRIGF